MIVLAVLGASVLAKPAGADTQGDLQKAKTQLATLLQRIDDATKRVDGLRADLDRLLVRVDASRRSVEATQGRIVDTQLAIRTISQGMSAQQAALDQRAAQAYIEGPAGDFVELLGSSSFLDLEERLADMQVRDGQGAQAAGDLAAQQANLAANQANLQALFVTRRAAQDQLDADVASAQSELTLRQSVLDQLSADQTTALALVKQLTAQRQREIERALARERGNAPPPPPSGGEQMRVVDLIKYYFAPLGQTNVVTALCVGWRESRYIPTVVNPASGAAGVYQFMPNLWPWFSSTAGWGGADVFDPVANVAVAAYIVAHFGWSPWHSDSGVCNT